MDPSRVVIPGSEPASGSSNEHSFRAALPSGLQLTVTVLVRRPANTAGPSTEELMAGTAKPQSREQAEAAMSADPADLRAVRMFAGQYDLKVVGEAAVARQVKLQGSVCDLEQAFGVTLTMGGPSGQSYLTYQGSLSVPSFLAGIVLAVLGLDRRPVARTS